MGYVQGINEAHSLTTQLSKSKPLYCIPKDGMSTDQLLRVLVKYLRSNPEILHESGRIHVLIAFRRAFPCGA
jgi:hypothetical protein